MIRYYKLFDLLNRKEMKKSELLKVISAPTLGKLQRGENVKSDAIDKICLFLECQPGDIMQVFKLEKMLQPDGTVKEYKSKVELFDEDYTAAMYLDWEYHEAYVKTRKEMEKYENNT